MVPAAVMAGKGPPRPHGPTARLQGRAPQFQVSHEVPFAPVTRPSLVQAFVAHTRPTESAVDAAGSGVAAA